MKKINILLYIISIICFSNVVYADGIIGNFSGGGDADYFNFGHATSYNGYCMNFSTNTSNILLTKYEPQLKKVNSPIIMLGAALYGYNTTSGWPSTFIVNSTTWFNASTLTTSYAYYNFSFNISLNSSTNYYLCVKTNYTIAGTNYVYVNKGALTGYNVTRVADSGAFGNELGNAGYTNRIWGNVTASSSSSLTVALNQPYNNLTTNSSYINFSYTPVWSNYNITSCFLYTNMTGSWVTNVTNATTTPSYTVVNNSVNNFTNIYFANDGNYTWNIGCSTQNGTIVWNTNNYTFVKDSVKPTYTTNFNNNSVYFKTNITAWFNLSDENLIHSYNLSIDNLIILQNESYNLNNINLSLNYDPTNLSFGNHVIKLVFSDGHTDNTISPYIIDKCILEDCLIFNNNIKIQQKDNSMFDKWNTEKKKDRYTFEFEPYILKSSYIFKVDIEQKFDIVQNSVYGQWIITKDKKWIDFAPYKPSIRKISDTVAEVTIDKVDPKLNKLTFQSIGDLNTVELNFTFVTTNATLNYSTSVSELEVQNMYLSIYKPSPITATTANLTWNGSIKNITKVSFVTYDYYSASFITTTVSAPIYTMPFYWNYSIFAPIMNESGIINSTQTVIKMLIDNCTTYTIRAINFTIKDDNTSSNIVSNVKGWFKIWNTDENFYTPFNITWGGYSNYSLCIYNESQLYNVYAQIEYDSENYTKETYYLYNITLNNVTKLMDLYLTYSSTPIVFTVTDENDKPVQGSYIHILRYDLPTNTAYTTEILKTSSSGTDIGHIILDTTWYKFMIYYNNELKLETQPVKITTTSKSFRINLGSDYISNFNYYKGIYSSLIYNNATKTFSFTVTTPTGLADNFCLKIEKITPLATTEINETCLSTASGVIMTAIGESVGTSTYVATGYLVGSVDTLNILDISFDEGYKSWGRDGILATIFIRIAVACIGIWSPVIAILMLAFVDITMVIMGLYRIGLVTFIVYLILIFATMWRLGRK